MSLLSFIIVLGVKRPSSMQKKIKLYCQILKTCIFIYNYYRLFLVNSIHCDPIDDHVPYLGNFLQPTQPCSQLDNRDFKIIITNNGLRVHVKYKIYYMKKKVLTTIVNITQMLSY